MDKKQKKQIGRPRKEPGEGERVQLSFRVTPELKRRLDAAAERSGRSQSQEAEFRLERSFDHQHLLEEALSLKFGRAGAGILLAMAFIMELSGKRYLVAEAWRDVPNGAGIWDVDPVRWDRVLSMHWADDPDSRKVGMLCMLAVFAMLPPHSVQPKQLLICLKQAIQDVQHLRSDHLPPAHGAFREEIETIRSLINHDMIERPDPSVPKDTVRALEDLVDLLGPAIADFKRYI